MKKKFPYLINILWSDEDDCYIAEVPEMDGCITHGRTPEQAAHRAQDAIASWLKAARRLGHAVPAPVATRPVSGKFNVRLPKQLHRFLVLKAAREGVSLNQLITASLAQTV
ncbi:MAG: type II toxin-antitoxin system HicB family antitoxin [Deltaproteobacteria bacterium]|nr:type II toxin-antitoxin system HicB family antitoxin [Deltaproteobacteria bacterium]